MQINKTIGLGVLALSLICALIAIDWHPILGDVFSFFQFEQRAFHDRLATNMRELQAGSIFWPSLSLIVIGFLYGIFHAIGPGHGKLVVTSYMLANERSLKRGVIIAAAASLMQALVAIAVVLGLFYLLGLARSQTEYAAIILEAISFGLIALVGFNLLRRGLKETLQLRKPTHVHDDHCGCGHAHMPGPQEIERAQGIWPLALMIISIGIRPCSGAIILLLFACLIGVIGAGILATLAMAVGTAITTCCLAMAAVYSKNWILKRLQHNDKALAITHAGLGIAGGLLIMALGLLFMLASIDMAKNWGANAPAGDMPLMHLPSRG